MLHVFFGSDRAAVRDNASDFVEKKLSPEGTLTTLDAGEYQPGQLSDALGATSLFGGEEWFMIDGPSENTDLQEDVENALEAMAESPNTFVVLEGPLLAGPKKKYTKFAETMEEFTAPKGEHFNAFAMADALATKDKRRLWVLLQEAKLEGMRDEEIIGVLWWQLKSLRLAAETSSAKEAGMKDFPYNKAKRALGKFPQEHEVRTISQDLLERYHAGHAGLRDMDVALEEWVLTL